MINPNHWNENKKNRYEKDKKIKKKVEMLIFLFFLDTDGNPCNWEIETSVSNWWLCSFLLLFFFFTLDVLL